ncbi:uncharacterized protein PV09_09763 [Verruconis gallopava]|uniref:Deacetylase sirtuin-type domain-containing protein n=1 Tax=Verruconis gallopava TaxID=253628 RepID=A0A0D2AHL1_9PEZI|nr:uncharacterized protein PV09_09763 [Verruconis gallopava]KIV98413.1 hypothetical protein PV09_09763 [Verruconis gallopava]
MRIRLPLKPLVFTWRHGASLVRYKTRCVSITPGIPFTFGPSSTACAVHRLFLFAKMPKHQTCTDRHEGSSFSPYQKPSIQASITNIAGSSEELQTFQQVASQLAEKQRIIIISGAGISTNAGIPCFKSFSRTKMASRNIFDLSAYSSLDSANLLHQSELQILESASRGEPQPFELFMEELAQLGRLHRHYTQNIDCRTSKLPALSKKTLNLHGRLDRLRCHIYSQHTVSVKQQPLRKLLGARCPVCDKKNEERIREGKRLHSVGFLRPDVLLYNESDGADPEIMKAFEEDLHQNVDALIIVGTTLHIPVLQEFATKICRKMKESRGKMHSPRNTGMVLWISKEKSKVRAKLKSLIDSEFLQDCDEFAVQISPWLRNLNVTDVREEREVQSPQSSIFNHTRPIIRSIVDCRSYG